MDIFKKYYLYEVTASPGFILPVITLYVLTRGIDLTSLGALVAVASVVTLAIEVPTGVITDILGRKNMLLAATLIYIFTMLIYLGARGFWPLLVAYVFRGVAKAFLSGSDDAWLYDALKQRAREDEYTRVVGRGKTLRAGALSISVLAGGALYTVNPVIPLYLTIILNVVGVFVILSMPADHTRETDDGLEISVRDRLRSIRQMLTRREARWFVAAAALFFGIQSGAETFVQPIVEQTLKEDTAVAGVQLSALPTGVTLGVMYSVVILSSGVTSYYAGEIRDRLGGPRSLLLALVVISFFTFLPSIFKIAAFPMFFVLRFTKSGLKPIVKGVVNEDVNSVGRATAMSSLSMLFSIAAFPFEYVTGVLTDSLGLFNGLVPLSAIGFAVAILYGAERILHK